MKKLESKTKLALLISGLALFMFNSLQCAAQDIWGIWVEQKGEESYFYPGKDQPPFRGSRGVCVQKCDSLNARYSDNGKRDARAVAEKMEEMGSFTISEDAKQQGEEYENELKKDPQNTFGLPKYSPKILPSYILITDSEYRQAAEECVKSKKTRLEDFNTFANQYYSVLCEKHGYNGDEKDKINFKLKLDDVISNNFAKYLPKEQYEAWVEHKWFDEWNDWPNDDFTSFAKERYVTARKEYYLVPNSQKYRADFDIFQDRLGNAIENKLKKLRPKNY